MARRSGRRTDYSWSNFGDVTLGVDIGVARQQVVGLATVASPQTLTRIRGLIGATLDTAAVDEHGLLLLGLTIMTADAFAADAPPEIGNNSNDEASWIWQGAIYLSSGAEAAIVPDQLSGSVAIDTKAMRKVKPLDVCVLVMHAPADLWLDQGGTIDVHSYMHTLLGE